MKVIVKIRYYGYVFLMNGLTDRQTNRLVHTWFEKLKDVANAAGVMDLRWNVKGLQMLLKNY